MSSRPRSRAAANLSWPDESPSRAAAWFSSPCWLEEFNSIRRLWESRALNGAFFDKMSAQWREEQNRCLREIARHETAEQSYMDEGVQILELACNAQKLFERQHPREKRRLLNFLLSNCSWEDGEVVATFRQPFDFLAQTNAVAMRSETGLGSESAKSEIWLGN
jgi:site-specific DNA recombinase